LPISERLFHFFEIPPDFTQRLDGVTRDLPMTLFQRQIAIRVLSVHAAVILLVVVVPFMRGCFTPKPKEIITFIEFGGPAAQVDIEQVSRMAEPEAPAPEPEPAPIPEPVKQKPKVVPKAKPKEKAPEPKPVEKKPEPKPKAPEKPKWKPVDSKDIKKGKKINEAPSKPTLSASDISKGLSGISSGATGNPNQFNDFYARVKNQFFNRWTPPATATASTGSVIVRISFRKNGQITKRAKIKGSGDTLYDRTVMDAVNAVSMVPNPPSDYPYDYVEVTFVLDN
jgi:TonB family protein